MHRVTLVVPKLGGLRKAFRATAGRALVPKFVSRSMLHRVGVADVRIGRRDKQGRPVVTMRTFEQLAACTEGVNPYTDDFALVVDAAGGGAPHVFVFDSARLRPAPMLDPDPKAPAALAHKVVANVAGRLVPGAQLMLDRANMERVRRLFSDDPGAAARRVHTTELNEAQEVALEQITWAYHYPTLGDDYTQTIQREYALAEHRFGELVQRVVGASHDFALAFPAVGPRFVEQCEQRARHTVRAALTNLREHGDAERDPRLVLLTFEAGPARFVRDVAEGNA